MFKKHLICEKVLKKMSDSGSDNYSVDEDIEPTTPEVPVIVRSTPRRTTPRTNQPAFVPSYLGEPNGTFVLPKTAFEAQAINDKYRRYGITDGEGSDLWSLDQVAKAYPESLEYSHPTLVPKTWIKAEPLTQIEYTQVLHGKFEIIKKVLPMENVVIAGGSAAWPLSDRSQTPSDIDFFIYGMDPHNESALWAKANELVKKICEGLKTTKSSYISASVSMVPGVITIIEDTYDSPSQKFQIVLRAYPSVSAILHAFDLQSSMVAYDGSKTYLTTFGAYGQIYRTNVVVPAYRSTTYESRLFKYFIRGYALMMPNLRKEAIIPNTKIELTHVSLEVDEVIDQIYMIGELKLPKNAVAAGTDYSPFTELQEEISEHGLEDVRGLSFAHAKSMNYNFYDVITGKDRFVLMDYYANMYKSRSKFTLDKYAEKGGPMFTEVYPRETFVKMVEKAVRRVCPPSCSNVGIATLKQIFGLNDEQIIKITMAIIDMRQRNPNKKLSLQSALQPFCDALLAKYDAVPDYISWWIVEDPGRQYSGSFDPRMENASDWYGKEAVEAKAFESIPSNNIYSLCAVKHPEKPIFDGDCPLCHEEIKAGSANSMILDCGHVFHVIFGNECMGLLSWLKDHHECPCCKQIVVTTKEDQDEEVKRKKPKKTPIPPIEIQVEL